MSNTPPAVGNRSGFDPVLGDLGLYELMAANEVKAMRIELRLAGAERYGGPGTRQQVIAALPDDVRPTVQSPPFASSWISNRVLMELDRTIVALALGGDVTRLRLQAREMSREEISTVYKFVIRMASTDFLARRLCSTFSSFYRRGAVEVSARDGHSWQFELRDAVLPLYSCSHNIPGWIEAALELNGVRDGRIDHVACRHRGDAACRWIMRV